jgi:hypothetical protein
MLDQKRTTAALFLLTDRHRLSALRLLFPARSLLSVIRGKKTISPEHILSMRFFTGSLTNCFLNIHDMLLP